MAEEIRKEEIQNEEIKPEEKEEIKEEEEKKENVEDLEKLKADLNKCLVEKEEYLNGWKRARADFINYTKEEAVHFETLAKLAVESLAKELLIVLDSFHLGLNMLSGDEKAQRGLLLIQSQLEDILKKYGITKIPVEIGKPFDPKTQESFMEEISAQYPEGSVLEEIETGYFLNNQVLRPAKVKIAKASKDS